MFKEILNSNKSLEVKLEELKRFTSDPAFLDVLISPSEFLNDLIPFAQKVFQKYPPDFAFQFGQTNETRVFLIRLFIKLNYSQTNNRDMLPMVYDLIVTDTLFNRYLSLKILFPILD